MQPISIFISFSGNRSRDLAVALADWIPKVLPLVETWMPESWFCRATTRSKMLFEPETNSPLSLAYWIVSPLRRQ